MAMETFRAFIERMVTPHGGRLWTWAGFGGLVLFPLRAASMTRSRQGARRPSCACCGCASPVSCTMWRRGPCRAILSFPDGPLHRIHDLQGEGYGAAIAESLNAIFHLGQKYTGPGQFFLTEDALDLAPERLRSTWVPGRQLRGQAHPQDGDPALPGLPQGGEWPSGD